MHIEWNEICYYRPNELIQNKSLNGSIQNLGTFEIIDIYHEADTGCHPLKAISPL